MRDHGHSSIASRGPHKVKPRSGLSAAICLTSCTALVHGTALGARTAWGPHLLTPPACVVPQGLPRGAARTDRLLAHHGAARLCLSLPAFLAPLAPPHTRRFLGDSLDAPQLDGQTSSTRCMGREWARRLASFRVFYMLRALGTSASSTSTWRSTTTGGGFSRPVLPI